MIFIDLCIYKCLKDIVFKNVKNDGSRMRELYESCIKSKVIFVVKILVFRFGWLGD